MQYILVNNRFFNYTYCSFKVDNEQKKPILNLACEVKNSLDYMYSLEYPR
jgi:hypothetical protein